jgi:hypothetical protein
LLGVGAQLKEFVVIWEDTLGHDSDWLAFSP